MTFWAYMLRCNDGTYYTGHTDNLDGRIAQHHVGGIGGYTQTRRPVQFVWSQEFPSRIEALTAERQIKGWSRRKKEALIRGDWQDLHDAAIPPGERALRLRSGRTEGGQHAPDAELRATLPTAVRAERNRSTCASANDAASLSVRAERSRST